MKRYLPWMVAIGVLIAGAAVWYLYGSTAGAGSDCQKQSTCPTSGSSMTPSEQPYNQSTVK